ncbi:RNA methyltransferase [Algimonas arctica]|uniref:RNA methyltransferase n=1 Tax=Algimonas arctica TaxID=1479486 RepID=A0A8J3CTQ2_9PROT|nr:RNA methyltransferase [Algimonas arctica]GHB01447.1 RNA methyltransferase [Algimonas arctica]
MGANKPGKEVHDQLGRAVGIKDVSVPAVILVNPQLGENIGSAARSMLNFGLTDLRLVVPRDGWPNPAAVTLAAGALSVLESARLFDTTEEAIADLHYVMSATARRRGIELPVIGVEGVGSKVRAMEAKGTRTGILFGPENAGLSNADVALSDAILTYPVNPAFQSLNLAQAVNVFAFLYAAGEGVPDTFNDALSAVAPREDLVRLFDHLETELEDAGFFYPVVKKELMRHNIRAPLTRAQMTKQEVRTFRGIVKALSKGRGHSLKSGKNNDK